MQSTFALTLAKWSLDLITKLVKANIRLHNADALQDDMAAIFVVNHFTRLETMLLPYVLHKHFAKEVWGLAAAELFKGRLGEFLRSTGTVSTRDPDRDKIIVRSLLINDHHWMIFPEGAMIKDKKVVDKRGRFQVFSDGRVRPPHTGAAVVALRAEYYRNKLRCLADRPDPAGLRAALERFELTPGADGTAARLFDKRTVIIPVNITYFPIRARDNFFVRAAARIAGDMNQRALEELSVEGTILSEDTDVDITLGAPIDIAEGLAAPEFAEVMACGENDLEAIEEDPGSLFNDAARALTQQYMQAIYHLTTVNYDHIFATLFRYQRARSFTERAYRNRIFLCVHEINHLEWPRLHADLRAAYRDIVYEDPSPKFNDFIELLLNEGVLEREGGVYKKNFAAARGAAPFHAARWKALAEVIANEIEPLRGVTERIRRIARMPRGQLSKRIREIFLAEDQARFEADYEQFFEPETSKGPEVGRPFLMRPKRIRAGVVLSHGYLAAPLEMRPLAEFLAGHGYAVYCVRLQGHGTSPADLAGTRWEQWYESFNRGYAIIKTLTDRIFLGGFSTGGCLALLAAARKGPKIQGVFSINAPLQINKYSFRLAPSMVTLNTLLKKLGRGPDGWEYVQHQPENERINYGKNPLVGVRELGKAIDAMEGALVAVATPALIVQGANDPVVNPASAQLIFERINTPHKELTLFERNWHGILDGEGSQHVFERVLQFLQHAPPRPDPGILAAGAAAGEAPNRR